MDKKDAETLTSFNKYEYNNGNNLITEVRNEISGYRFGTMWRQNCR